MKPPIKVMLVEDHAGYREVITRALANAKQIELISQFGTAEFALRELMDCAPNQTPDIVLLDLNLPGTSGFEAIPWFRKYTPEAKIIIITQSDKEADVLSAISLGASGYLLKSSTANQIKDSIQIVHEGGASLDPRVAKYIINILQKHKTADTSDKLLSNRELEILILIGDGKVKKEIADQLDIGVSTVAYHIKNIYEKLEVTNAPAAVSKGFKRGLI
jgi:DNA-binding NarL/FixJ family response regulator